VSPGQQQRVRLRSGSTLVGCGPEFTSATYLDLHRAAGRGPTSRSNSPVCLSQRPPKPDLMPQQLAHHLPWNRIDGNTSEEGTDDGLHDPIPRHLHVGGSCQARRVQHRDLRRPLVHGLPCRGSRQGHHRGNQLRTPGASHAPATPAGTSSVLAVLILSGNQTLHQTRGGSGSGLRICSGAVCRCGRSRSRWAAVRRR